LFYHQRPSASTGVLLRNKNHRHENGGDCSILKSFFKLSAQKMNERNVRFLHVRGVVRWNYQSMAAQIFRISAAVSEKPDCDKPEAPRFFQSEKDVRRSPACGNAEKNITGLAECFHLSGKDVIKCFIVPPRR
jgi:hypothetical protein